MQFMFMRAARLELDGRAPAAQQQQGSGAILLAPVPAQGMRYALPGERPPSKYAPGQDDGLIDRYDAWARAFQAGGVKRG